MRQPAIRSCVLIATGFAAILPLLASAADLAPAAIHVRVFAGHYAVGSDQFSDAAALQAALAPAGDRVLRLEDCGPVSSGALLAAVERLYGAHSGVIEIRSLPAGEPECAPARGGLRSTDVVVGSGAAGYGATDREGRSIMP